MLRLHNTISKKELKKRLFLDKNPRFTLSFYQYFLIKNVSQYRDDIYKTFYKYKVFGRVYVSEEGINAQISVPILFYSIIKKFVFNLDNALINVRFNKALNNNPSFSVLIVKVKKKIIDDGIMQSFFDPKKVGIYLKAQEVNTMLKDDNVIFIDMRNSYEYKIGHFEKAIEIKSQTFREQLQKIIPLMDHAKEKKIVMYCTGGIRCEKATSWMYFNGFKHLYHLEGGIIGYVHDAKKNGLPILFKGKIFVFDHRMSEKVSNEIISTCQQCNRLSDTYVNCANDLCHLLFIQCAFCTIDFHGCCSTTCIEKIDLK